MRCVEGVVCEVVEGVVYEVCSVRCVVCAQGVCSFMWCVCVCVCCVCVCVCVIRGEC